MLERVSWHCVDLSTFITNLISSDFMVQDQHSLHQAGHWILMCSAVQLPDEVDCSAGKRITSGRPSPKQRAGVNCTAHWDSNRQLLFATEISPQPISTIFTIEQTEPDIYQHYTLLIWLFLSHLHVLSCLDTVLMITSDHIHTWEKAPLLVGKAVHAYWLDCNERLWGHQVRGQTGRK